MSKKFLFLAALLYLLFKSGASSLALEFKIPDKVFQVLPISTSTPTLTLTPTQTPKPTEILTPSAPTNTSAPVTLTPTPERQILTEEGEEVNVEVPVTPSLTPTATPMVAAENVKPTNFWQLTTIGLMAAVVGFLIAMTVGKRSKKQDDSQV